MGELRSTDAVPTGIERRTLARSLLSAVKLDRAGTHTLNPLTVAGALKCLQFYKIIKNRLLEIAFQFFSLHSYDTTLVTKNKQIACRCPIFFEMLFSKLTARALDVLAGVRLDFFYGTDFGGSENSKEKVYEVYSLFGLSWSAVSIRTGAAS